MNDPIHKVDWHWHEPMWPGVRMNSEGGRLVAERLTVWMCFWCKYNFIEPDREGMMKAHAAMLHPGKPIRYTVYPPAIGVVPKGGDA